MDYTHESMLDAHCKQAFNIGQKARQARKQGDEARANFHNGHFYKIKALYTIQKEKDRLQVSYNLGYQEG